VFDLVRWSFVVALTPLALGLAWRLILLVANSIARGLARPSVNDEPCGQVHTVSRQRTSRYIAVSGWTPTRETNDLGRRRDHLRDCEDAETVEGALAVFRSPE
jgi:hypothetical protein